MMLHNKRRRKEKDAGPSPEEKIYVVSKKYIKEIIVKIYMVLVKDVVGWLCERQTKKHSRGASNERTTLPPFKDFTTSSNNYNRSALSISSDYLQNKQTKVKFAQ